MGASKRIAGPCQKSNGPAGRLLAVRLAGAPGTHAIRAVTGGGLICHGHGHRPYHAVPSRYDGRSRTSMPSVAHRALWGVGDR